MLSHNSGDKNSAQHFFSAFIRVVCLNFAVIKDFFVEKIQPLSSRPNFLEEKWFSNITYWSFAL